MMNINIKLLENAVVKLAKKKNVLDFEMFIKPIVERIYSVNISKSNIENIIYDNLNIYITFIEIHGNSIEKFKFNVPIEIIKSENPLESARIYKTKNILKEYYEKVKHHESMANSYKNLIKKLEESI